jgi:23S rRNA (cytosine1962-C5)-methyltransferase
MSNIGKYPLVSLKKGKDEAVKRFHPWIFSGAIHNLPKGLNAGDLVYVCDHLEQVLGVAFFEAGNIALKMLSFSKEVIDYHFWLRKISVALKLREQLGLLNNASTTAWRLVHSEGDGLPGLIVDIYGTTAVFQAQSAGMYLHRNAIAKAIVEVMKGQITSCF